MTNEDWRRIFMSVPALVSVKGVLTNGVWTLFWRHKSASERDILRYILKDSI